MIDHIAIISHEDHVATTPAPLELNLRLKQMAVSGLDLNDLRHPGDAYNKVGKAVTQRVSIDNRAKELLVPGFDFTRVGIGSTLSGGISHGFVSLANATI
jgi:hypothetical protein